MIDVLHVKTSLSIPSVKCFDKDTEITMNDGSIKKISEIKTGDILIDNNEVTACIKVVTKGSTIYNLHDIIVSDSHIVQYFEKWIPVSKHPDAICHLSYTEPYLYCLNTTNKTIQIGKYKFTDWDEIYDKDIHEIMVNKFIPINNLNEIHNKIDSGFKGDTKIKLNNGKLRDIKDIIVGDILENNEEVYGIVEINGKNIDQQFQYNLGEDLVIEGTSNLLICDKKINHITTFTFNTNNKKQLNKKHDKFYHLLTNKDSFYIGNIRFYDYNASIDILLEKYKGKILSMKYV